MPCGSLHLPDAFLASVLDVLSSNKFTVIYTTTPPHSPYQPTSAETESYEMDAQFQAPVHMELKRDFSVHKRASDANITLPDGPLFERYQYFTPGIFSAFLMCGLYMGDIILISLYRPFHGTIGLCDSSFNSLRWHQWSSQPPGLLRRFR